MAGNFRKFTKFSDDLELVNVRNFMSHWGIEAHDATRVLPSDHATSQKNIAAAMNVSLDTVAELEEVCGRKSLFRGTEPKKKDFLYKMNEQPPNESLHCLKYQIESNKKRVDNNHYNMQVKSCMKYYSSLSAYKSVVTTDASPKDIPAEHRVPMPNVILTVEVTKCLLHKVNFVIPREREIFYVLGSQTLSELRDKIECSSDKIIPGDYSNMPDVDSAQLQTLGEMYKSSFFFIEDVFYNDMREPDNKDYSKNIIEWAKNTMPDKKFTTKEMSQFTFFDLDIRFGKHYLFTHQGNCEHAVLFRDIRLFNAVDSQDIRNYPLLVTARMRMHHACHACNQITAKWSVSNCLLLPFEPTQLCGFCFKNFLYTEDGQKISDFKAYHFAT